MLRRLLCHGAIVISGMYFVFFGIDRVNSAMSFIDNDITKVLLVILGVISIINACMLIREDRARERRRQRRLEQKAQERSASRRSK